jgi:23S rRNA (adenine1618-N6)-methyltransferase
LAANPKMQPHISLRLQSDPERIFHGIVAAQEQFDFTLCNPPFHPSAGAAKDASRQKWQKLNKGKSLDENPGLNFGGQSSELICTGGESGFLARMIAESAELAGRVFWFSSLVSKASNIPALEQQLRALGATDVRVLEMAQGEKHSRLLAWTFLDKKQRRAWRKARWPQPQKP